MPRGDVGHGLAADFPFVRICEVSAHRLQHLVDACACRVHADMGDGDFAARRNEGRNNEKGCGGRIAGNFYLLRL